MQLEIKRFLPALAKYGYLLLLMILLFGPSAVNAERIPLFYENQGQITQTDGQPSRDVLYYAQYNDCSIYILSDRLSFVFEEIDAEYPERTPSNRHRELSGNIRMHRVDMLWLGGNQNAEVIPGSTEGMRKNFYGPNHPDGVTGLVGAIDLTIANIYPNIDMVLRFIGGNLKYDFVVHPGGDPDQIILGFDGGDGVELNAEGELKVQTSLGEFAEGAPFTFQVDESGMNEIECNYVLENNTVRFDLGAYNADKELIIDPLRKWSTYCGGSNYEWLNKIDVGTSGDLYACGMTVSANFPVTTGAFQGTIASAGMDDMFLSRMKPDGSIVWATYYGGSSSEESSDITLDSIEDVHVIGTSISNDFPATWGSPVGGRDIVILHFDSTGNRIKTTMFGGYIDDYGYGIEHIPGGGFYLVGETYSPNFPVTWSFQTSLSGSSDCFMVRLHQQGYINYSTYLGGTSYEAAFDVEVDSNKAALISGYTYSTNFPVTSGCYQGANAGNGDAFLTKVDFNGSMLWSTYFGGSAADVSWAIAVDDSNNTYLTGETWSNDLPITPGILHDSLDGNSDIILASFDDWGALNWSTYVGGDDEDGAFDILWDPLGYINLSGWTASSDFPTTNDAFQDSLGGDYDAYLLTIKPDASIAYSTYYGGSDYDGGYGLATDEKGALYLGGETGSTDFPVDSTAFQTTAAGNWDAWVAKFDFCESLTYSFNKADEICAGSNAWIDVTAAGGAPPLTYLWSTGDTTADLQTISAGSYTLEILDDIGCKKTKVIEIDSVAYTPALFLGNDTTICAQDSMILDAGSGFDIYSWQGGSSAPQFVAKQSGTYWVNVTDSNNCSSSDTISISKTGPTPAFQGIATGLSVQFSDLTGGMIQWYWDFGDGNTSTSQSPTHVYDSAATYLVCLTATDSGGCEGTSCVMTALLPPLEIPEDQFHSITLFPNPAKTHINLKAEKPMKGGWEVIDLQGKTMLTGYHKMPNNNIKIEVQSLPAGMYALRFNHEYIGQFAKLK